MRCPRASAWRALGSALLVGVALALATGLIAPASARAADPLGEVTLDVNGPSRTHTRFPAKLERGMTYEMRVSGQIRFFDDGTVNDALFSKSPGIRAVRRPQLLVSTSNVAAAFHAPIDGLDDPRLARPAPRVLKEETAYNSNGDYTVQFTNLASDPAGTSLWFAIPRTFAKSPGERFTGGSFTVQIFKVAGFKDVRGRLAFSTDKDTVGKRTKNNKAPFGHVPVHARLLGTVNAEGLARLAGGREFTKIQEGFSSRNAFFGRGLFRATLRKAGKNSVYQVSLEVLERKGRTPIQSNRASFRALSNRSARLGGRFEGFVAVTIRVTRTDMPWCSKGKTGSLAVTDVLPPKGTPDAIIIEVCDVRVRTWPKDRNVRGRDKVNAFARGLTA